MSTSAGIPDFRSGLDTVLKTGPGVWELKAHKADRPAAAKTVSTLQVGGLCASGWALCPKHECVRYVARIAQAIPTPTHMALVGLERAGALKHLISQVLAFDCKCQFHSSTTLRGLHI